MGSASGHSVHTDDPQIRPGRRIVAVHPAADAFTALTVMRRNEVRHLPVVDGDRCVGLITESDLLRALARGADGAGTPAGMLCHRPAPSVPAGTSLAAIAAAMVGAGTDATIVVQDGMMVGLVTGSDVLGAVTTKWRTGSRTEAAAAAEPAWN